MSEKIKLLVQKWKGIKHKEIVLVILLSLLLFLFFFSSLGKLSFNDEKTSQSNTFSVDNYVSGLEKRLENILTEMDGVGNARVMITVSSGIKTVPHYKEDGSVLTSGGKPIVEKEEFPTPIGVVVVSDGADSYLVKSQIIAATVSLLGIKADRVQVYRKMK
jgi:stage III sporulation protein AG